MLCIVRHFSALCYDTGTSRLFQSKTLTLWEQREVFNDLIRKLQECISSEPIFHVQVKVGTQCNYGKVCEILERGRCRVESDEGSVVEMDIADIIGAERSKCEDVHVKKFVEKTCSNQLISEAFEYLDLLTGSEDLVFDLTKKLYSKTIFGLTQRTYFKTGSTEFAEPPPTTPEDVYKRDEQIREVLKRYYNSSQEGKGLFAQDGVSSAKLASGMSQFRSQFETLTKDSTDASPEHFRSWRFFTGVNVELFKNVIGTISTVRASTADIIEGNMSRHKHERTHRESLNEFNIQAGIHCKQWKLLKGTSQKLQQKLQRLVDS